MPAPTPHAISSTQNGQLLIVYSDTKVDNYIHAMKISTNFQRISGERERDHENLLTSSRPFQNEGTWSLSPLGAGGIAGSLYQKAIIVTMKVTPAGMA